MSYKINVSYISITSMKIISKHTPSNSGSLIISYLERYSSTSRPPENTSTQPIKQLLYTNSRSRIKSDRPIRSKNSSIRQKLMGNGGTKTWANKSRARKSLTHQHQTRSKKAVTTDAVEVNQIQKIPANLNRFGNQQRLKNESCKSQQIWKMVRDSSIVEKPITHSASTTHQHQILTPPHQHLITTSAPPITTTTTPLNNNSHQNRPSTQ
jgi:hypothetical protein